MAQLLIRETKLIFHLMVHSPKWPRYQGCARLKAGGWRLTQASHVGIGDQTPGPFSGASSAISMEVDQKQPGLQSMPIWDVVMSAPVFLLKKKKKVAVCMLGEVLVPLLYSSFQPTRTLGWADGSSPGILDLIWDYETRVAFLALAWPCHSHTDTSRVNQRFSLNKQKSCFNECNVLIG